MIDWYCMCKKSGETFDHLLLHCEIASALWNSILGFFGSMGHALSRDRFLSCWRGQWGSPQSEAIWKMIPPYLMWCIWKERNDRIFEDSERTVVELKAFFFNTLYQWMVAYECFHISSFHALFGLFFLFWLGVSLVYFLCTWMRPLHFLMKFIHLYKKMTNFERFLSFINFPCA